MSSLIGEGSCVIKAITELNVVVSALVLQRQSDKLLLLLLFQLCRSQAQTHFLTVVMFTMETTIYAVATTY